MAVERVIFLMFIVVTSLIHVASAIAGTAGSYDQLVPSTCFGPQDQGTMVAAVSDALYRNGAACGIRYRVRCTGPPQLCRNGEVTVRVVDQCAECQGNQMDLSRQAFSVIAAPNAGRINIDFTQV